MCVYMCMMCAHAHVWLTNMTLGLMLCVWKIVWDQDARRQLRETREQQRLLKSSEFCGGSSQL